MVTPRLIDGYKLKRLSELQESCLIGARGFEPPTPCSQGKTKNKKWLVCLACQRQKRAFLGNSITIYHSVVLYTFNDF